MIYTVTLNPALDYFMDFDQAKLGQVNRATETRMLPYGKGIVESRMMSLLKVENTALGFLGGFPGKFIQDYLENIGSQSDFTQLQEQHVLIQKSKSMRKRKPPLMLLDQTYQMLKFRPS